MKQRKERILEGQKVENDNIDTKEIVPRGKGQLWVSSVSVEKAGKD